MSHFYVHREDKTIAEIISDEIGEDKVMIQIGRSVQKVVTLAELSNEWEKKDGYRP